VGEQGEVDPREPIGDFVVCHRGIGWSEAGPCRVGAILRKSDPRVALVPEVFRPLLEMVEVPRKD
jgi:hypothetical protein